MALNTAKASASTLCSAAQNLLDKKRYAEAETYLLEVLRRNMNDPAALALMAEVGRAKGNAHEALICIMAAINAAPNELSYKERLIEMGEGNTTADYNKVAVQAIMHCLESGDVLDCSRIRRLWGNHLFFMPAFHAAFGLADRKAHDPANKAWFEGLSDFSPLFNPFFLMGLKYIVVADARFEEFITHIRKHLLEDRRRGTKRFSPEESLALASALSHYSFHTDYIFDCTAEEQKEIDALRARIESGAETEPANIALFACYAPLYTLKNASHIAEIFSASPVMAAVVRKQILDYNELQRTAANITAITPIDDTVSTRVREQYEAFPYPRWNLISQEGVRRGWRNRNSKFRGDFYDKRISILSAGCGTGQETLMLSTVYPQAEILAVDLSRSSLAYASRKAEEYGIKNITFRQADILRLGVLEKKFDYISSMGVLHHMEDPVKGWQVLCGLLKPGGIMMIGLYSKIARRAVLEAQKVIRQRGYNPDVNGMRACRRESPQFLESSILKDISSYSDYYYMPMYRDLLFHVQEHDYDLLEIKNILEELKLEFLGISLRKSVLNEYAGQYPDDPGMVNLENWHLFEEQNPQTFREMYYLCCRKP